jgi:hypothetical protein
VLRWILFDYISSCLGSSSSEYINVSPIILGFCRDPLNILVLLVPFFLDLPQECRTIFCVMICFTTIHTCCWWECTFPSTISWFLEVVAHYWSFASSESSSSSSSTSIFKCYVVLRYLIILHRIILWMHIIILWLCIVVLLLCIVIWWRYLVELRCSLLCHHFFI